jgi:hypothetical protein
MRTEAEIRKQGIKALLRELGDVDTEIFIKNIIREPFNYTEWQRTLWNEKTVTEISKEAEKAAEIE